jgi:hypothetical protein
MFRTISQTAIDYRHSSLSSGRAGAVRGGDRLPWVPADASLGQQRDNFACLDGSDWQVHVYGGRDERLAEACATRRLALHFLPWGAKARDAGLQQDALYLVRPDGYVGLADPKRDPATLGGYLDAHGVTPGRRRPVPTALPGAGQ